MELRRRLIELLYADAQSLYGDFVNQSTDISNYIFSVTDGYQHIKNKTSSNRNVFTYYNGMAASAAAQIVSVPWFQVHEGDSVVVKLKNLQVIKGGRTVLQIYNAAKAYLTGWDVDFTTDMTSLVLPAKIIAEGRGGGIVGMNYYLAGYAEMYFNLEYWVNGIKYTGE